MQKTKLGLSVGFLGAMLCFSGMCMGYTATILLAGYVLLMEQDVWLKATAIKVMSIMVVFAVVVTGIGFIPDAIDLLNYFVALFGGSFSMYFLTNFVYLIQEIFLFLENLVFLFMGLKALKMDTVHMPLVDNLITKHMD